MRRSDWEARLNEYVEAHRGAVFRFGRLDCARFSAGAVKAITGDDPMKGLRSKYRDERTAKRLIAKLGGLDAFMDGKFERVPVAFAKRGDVVMAEDGNLGVCLGGHAAVVSTVPGATGLGLRPRSEWQAAWRV